MQHTRRDFLRNLTATGLLLGTAPALSPAARAAAYEATIDALRQGVRRERAAHTRYQVFGEDAAGEGYAGIAYLFGAIALSELIHAQNYNRVLVTLGRTPEAPSSAPPVPGTTKENVIAAMEAEIATIDQVYPALFEAVRKDDLAVAVRNVHYAWASHVQHRETLEKIRRYSPDYFETVARRIDDASDRYYVCRVCGSVQAETPPEECPICKQPPENYSFVDPDLLTVVE